MIVDGSGVRGGGRSGDPLEVTGRTCVEFAALLRRRGLVIGPEQTTAFYSALHLLERPGLREIYLAGRAVLVTQRNQYPVYDATFVEFFGPPAVDDHGLPPLPPPAVPTSIVEREADNSGTPSAKAADRVEEQADEARLVPSDLQVLKAKSFALMSPEERRKAAALIKRLSPELPRRRGRRREPAASGPHLDVRGLLRAALPTDGEPMRLPRRRVPSRERPLTLVIDVSGSMGPYALALLRFGHAMLHAGHHVEVFTAGVHLTRITESLRRSSVDAALRRIGTDVDDWDGGTLLGSSMRELIDRFGAHSAVRGALVVVCSDGLDRDDPETLGTAMRNLARRAHRVVWLNPLKGDPRYRPLARGMAAALPHVDVFLAGHNLVSFEEMCAALTARRTAA
ncbi:vWA domain-containing protein [Pseudonocardia bannensis]|uniref:vWA domain-containing protein n=1 Tax=Pseudonocardia bannensis TaxID=630973 RepID=UPI001B7D1460|nr:VWA domain-containing protein [Pseudonocardia bannensis]